MRETCFFKNPKNDDTISFFYYIDKKSLFFINNVMEAYEGIALVHTADSKKGIIEFMVPVSFKEEFLEIMNDFEKKDMAKKCYEDIKPFSERE